MAQPPSRIPTGYIDPVVRIFVGVLLFIALLYRQTEMTLFALTLLFLASGTKLWAKLALKSIRWCGEVDKQRAFPGESVTVCLIAHNTRFFPVSLDIAPPCADAFDTLQGTDPSTGATGLLGRQSARYRWKLRATTRGVHTIDPPLAGVGDIFGFFSRSVRSHEPLEVIVYPRIVPLRPLLLPARDVYGNPGAHSPIQDPAYILGTREYQPSRPARYIHWNASARHGRLQEKIFEPTQQQKILLALDVSSFSDREDPTAFEQTLEIAASLAVAQDRAGKAVGLVTNGHLKGAHSPFVPVSKHPRQLASLLELLARLTPSVGDTLVNILRHQVQLPWGISCVHFSMEPDSHCTSASEYFSSRNIPVRFVVWTSDRTRQPDKDLGINGIVPLDQIGIFPETAQCEGTDDSAEKNHTA